VIPLKSLPAPSNEIWTLFILISLFAGSIISKLFALSNINILIALRVSEKPRSLSLFPLILTLNSISFDSLLPFLLALILNL
jgi:hypothetical protein